MKENDKNEIHLDPNAVGIVADIINCSDLIIEDILEDAGIVKVPFSDEYLSGIIPYAPSSTPKPRGSPSVSVLSDGLRTQLGSPPPEDGWTAFISGRLASTPSPSPHTAHGSAFRAQFAKPHIAPISSPRPSQHSPNDKIPPAIFNVDSSKADYRRLLDRVIKAAKSKRGGFPSKGAFDVQDLLSALPINASEDPPNYYLPFGVRSENQLAHDMRVGAAGELYVKFPYQ